MDWSGITVLGDIMRRNADRCAEKAAFIDDARSVSFGEFNTRANRLNDALRRLGVRKGERVAFLSRNRTEYVEAFSVAKSGLIPVPLNWRLASPVLLAVLQDCRPAVIIAEESFTSTIDAVRGVLGPVGHFVILGPARDGWMAYETLLASGGDHEPPDAPGPEDIACITYTSGTTGTPKGAMLTHGALVENCRDAVETAIGLREDDVTLAAMPLFHVGGMWYHLHPSFAAGCTTVIRPGFAVADALAAIERRGVTNLHLVPTMLGDLIADPGAAQAARSLRLVFYAASSIPVELLRRAMRVLGHCRFMQSYGSTEAGMVTTLTPEDHERAARDPAEEHLLLSCGRALGRVEVRIEDEGGFAGQIGEILVSGPKIMAGYWGRDEATRAVLVEGWLRTGDVGRIDERGYVYIVDRKGDMVISGGENIVPSEVEQALYRHPDVLEAAVFGVPDARWVERVAAAVVLRPGAMVTPEQIIQSMRAQLAAYKCPKSIFIVDSLPRSAAGKVLKKDLRSQYGASGPATAREH